jgi:hypothetical protein
MQKYKGMGKKVSFSLCAELFFVQTATQLNVAMYAYMCLRRQRMREKDTQKVGHDCIFKTHFSLIC